MRCGIKARPVGCPHDPQVLHAFTCILPHPHPPLRNPQVFQIFTYLRTSPDDNQYAHPTDVVPFVDMYQEKVRAPHVLLPGCRPDQSNRLATCCLAVGEVGGPSCMPGHG